MAEEITGFYFNVCEFSRSLLFDFAYDKFGVELVECRAYPYKAKVKLPPIIIYRIPQCIRNNLQ